MKTPTHKIMPIFGTRPEAIKLAPLIKELERRGVKEYRVCITGQHREMLDQMLDLFEIKADHDLNVMTDAQTLEQITSKVLLGLEELLEKDRPDMVLVQGDTTTALMGALAAYYKKIPVAHIEAGLRTDDFYYPFPEELNRRLISRIANIHFAPTVVAQHNLLREGIASEFIFMTGNPVIDSLLWVIKQNRPFSNPELASYNFTDKRVVLVTTHRRENLGGGMEQIFKTILKLVKEFPDLHIIFPVHMNPAIGKLANEAFGDVDRVLLLSPLDYPDLAKVMERSYFVMTDSGGIQEEAPSLGKPVLVLRETTERGEGIQAGTARLVGTDPNRIYSAAKELLTDAQLYETMAQAVNPYGDGHATERIVTAILDFLDRPAEEQAHE